MDTQLITNRKGTYKWCFVPMCSNTSISTPDKYFASVPKEMKRRKAWITACRRDESDKKLSLTSSLFCCQDHFNMDTDMENFMRYKMVGGHLRSRVDVVPHIFECQKRLSDTSPLPASRAAPKGKRIAAQTPDVPTISIEDSDLFVSPAQFFHRLLDPELKASTTDAASQPAARIIMQPSAELLCRLCMKLAPAMEDIFPANTRPANSLDDLIERVTQIGVRQGDGLPTKVCVECIGQLKAADRFRDRCVTIDQALREIYTAENLVVIPDLSLVKSEALDENFSFLIPSELVQVQGETSIGENAVASSNSSSPSRSRKSQPNATLPFVSPVKRSPRKTKTTKRNWNEDPPDDVEESEPTSFGLFQCSVCQRSFRLKQNLVLHKRSHLGSNPLQGRLCKQSMNMTTW